MKLLKLSFKNLNSLVGEWSIDFKDKAYTTDPLFIITGPTGSGKTTILDAICLGIYGTTPRLVSESRGSLKEIISIGTNQCFAEVTFQTPLGNFRSCTRIQKKEKKSEDSIKITQEIVDADTNKVLVDNITERRNKIIEITGMDFTRFTRSILLAQGSFNAFLNASVNDRSTLLEKITGIDIYSQISMKTYERWKEEKSILEDMKKEIESQNILGQEEEAAIKEKLVSMNKEINVLEAQGKAASLGLAWLEKIAQIRIELAKLEAQKLDLTQKQLKFAPEAARLEKALVAMELEGQFTPLETLRLTIAKDRRNLIAMEVGIPKLEREHEEITEVLSIASKKCDAASQELQKNLPIISEVRQLDKEILVNKERVLAATGQKLNCEMRVKGSKETLKNDNIALASLKADLEANKIAREAAKADEALVSELTGLESEAKTFKEISTKIKIKEEEKKKAALLAQTATKEKDSASLLVNGLQQNLKLLTSELLAQQEKLISLVGEDGVSHWREKQQKGLFLQERLREIRQTYNTLCEHQSSLLTTKSQIDSSQLQLDTINKDNLQKSQKGQMLEKSVELMEQNLNLSRTISSLTAHREKLSDGVPCPLCGSLEHPYAQGNVPKASATELELTQSKNELKKLRDELSELLKKESNLSSTIKVLAQNLQQFEKNLESSNSKLSLIITENELDLPAPLAPDFEEKLIKVTEDNDKTLSLVQKVLQEADWLEKEILKLKVREEKAKTDNTQAEANLKEQTHREELCQADLIRLQQEALDLITEEKSKFTILSQNLNPFLPEGVSPENLEAKIKALSQRKNAWIHLNDVWKTLEKNTDILKDKIETETNRLAKYSEEYDISLSELAQIIKEGEPIISKRVALLGDRIPDEVESDLRNGVTYLEENLLKIDKARNEAGNKLSGQRNMISELNRRIKDSEDDLLQKEDTFKTALSEKGFETEASFLAARLQEEERSLLARTKEALKQDGIRINSLWAEKELALKTESEKNLTQASQETLSQELNNIAARSKELQEETGALNQRINDNEGLKLAIKEKLKALEQRQKIYIRFDNLNKFIGSAQGDKFKKFAQALTFDLLVHNANIQLQKMNKRYTLCQDKKTSMEFTVLDHSQGSVERSIKNLSGGETFLVSLSLALGLSTMSSRKTRVDSLFLDEGFGTLDEDTLDIALSALGELPRMEGKTIGLISHVAILKERVRTVIEVKPVTAARSIISGPGCYSYI